MILHQTAFNICLMGLDLASNVCGSRDGVEVEQASQKTEVSIEVEQGFVSRVQERAFSSEGAVGDTNEQSKEDQTEDV